MADTIFEAYNKTKRELERFGIEDYVFEAKQIIKHITGMTNTEILTRYNTQLTEFQERNLKEILDKRAARYPLQYIFGNWSFYGRDYTVGPGVLIPRADTETLIDCALKLIKDKKSPKIIDLCTGTGCIGITLACEIPDSEVTLLEKHREAWGYAYKNIIDNGAENVMLFEGDVTAGDKSDGKYDLIVSNPPYISDAEMDTVSPEVHFEPETALRGGEDGLFFYREIIKNYKDSLNFGGSMVFEVGIGQAEAVKELLRSAGFKRVQSQKDLNEIDRVVFGTLD